MSDRTDPAWDEYLSTADYFCNSLFVITEGLRIIFIYPGNQKISQSLFRLMVNHTTVLP